MWKLMHLSTGCGTSNGNNGKDYEYSIFYELVDNGFIMFHFGAELWT
jgi:hypothetical protein